jgi:hypothetical protein
VIMLLRELIDAGGVPGVGGDDSPRDAIARMANAWPLVSTAGATIARQDESYAPMVYYERVRLGMVCEDFFFDGMPHGVVAMGAPIKLELPAQQMGDLLYDDVVADRLKTLMALEGAQPGSAKRTKLASTLDGLPDVSPDVPVPARLFLSRMRSMCHGLRASQSATRFKQCDNHRCCSGGRLFYTGDKATVKHIMPGPDLSLSMSNYWMACSPLPEYEGPRDLRFCSYRCAEQWKDEREQLMPDKDLAWDADLRLRERESSRDARVLSAFDKAIERNGKLFHFIQKRKKKLRRGSAMSKADFNREMDARVEMVNIDTGLLYAATIYARLPNRRGSLTLPGEKAQWRNHAHEKHRNALLRVAQIYRQHNTRSPIHDLLDTPSFLRAIRSTVTNIF